MRHGIFLPVSPDSYESTDNSHDDESKINLTDPPLGSYTARRDWLLACERKRKQGDVITRCRAGSGTLGILDSGGWGVGGLTTFCGRDCVAIACYVQQRIT